MVFLITTTLTLVATALVGGSTFFLSNTTSSTATKVATGLLTAGVNVLVTPISAAVATIIYFDLRVRKEGFDVALLVQRLDVAPPPPPPAGPSFTATLPIVRSTPATSSPWAALDAPTDPPVDAPPPP